ncbi:MAG: glycosyltransferase family A protein [Planctomycetota bacterium]
MKTAAICIATYQRPEGVIRLLEALVHQAPADGWEIEVRVVNNDAGAIGTDWAEPMARAYPGARFEEDPRRNIAHARNTAIAMGPADAFLFIDDDEVPVTGWAAALLERLDDADAVFGPVMGRVPGETAGWLVRAGVFDKPGPDHDRDIDWRLSRTSSTAVRSEWFGPGNGWFDPEYGTSGGSDVEFFRRIYRDGARFVHERRALVYEDVEADRCNWRAVARRRYRAGAVLGRMDRAGSKLTRTFRLAKRVLAGAAVAVGGVPAFASGDPGQMFQGLCRAIVGIGAWRGHNTSYRVTRYPAKNNRIAEVTPCVSPC